MFSSTKYVILGIAVNRHESLHASLQSATLPCEDSEHCITVSRPLLSDDLPGYATRVVSGFEHWSAHKT
jgi:hypothetical protein